MKYEDLLDKYREGLQRPGPDVKRAVMAVLGDRARSSRTTWWHWLVRPHTMHVRPLLAAAALALVVGLSATVSALLTQNGDGSAVADGTVLVRFELGAPQAERVALAGSFNGWSDTTVFFSRSPGSDRWTVTVPLAPGEHEYLFVINGERWIPDPDAHAQVDDGFGNTNSLIVVGPRGVVRS